MTSLVFVLFSQNSVLVSKKIKSVTVSSVYPSICQDFTNGNREERYPEGENSKTQKKVQTIYTDKKKSTDHVHRSRGRVQIMYADQEEEYRPYTRIKKISTEHVHRSRRRLQTMYTDQEEENRPCVQIKKGTDHLHRSRGREQTMYADQEGYRPCTQIKRKRTDHVCISRRVQIMYTEQEGYRPCTWIKRKRTDHVCRSRRVQTMYTDQEKENRPCMQIKKDTDHVCRSRRRVQTICTDQDEVSVSGSGDLVTSGSPHRKSAKIPYLGFTWKVT